MKGEIQAFVRGLGTDHAIDIEPSSYPGGEPLIESRLLTAYPVTVRRLLVRPWSIQSLVTALFFVDALYERGHDRDITLVLPYVPGARQDRLNDDGDFLFTVKSVANEINARQFRSVIVVDPHSDVTPALIDRCFVVHAADFLQIPKGKYAAVVSPDAGAEKRAGRVARELDVPLIHAWKTRDVATGKISGFGVEQVKASELAERRVLVVDDICDGGGTFIGLAQQIKYDYDVDLHLYVTHGLFSKGVDPLKTLYSHIYCTDSIIRDRPGVIEIPICQRLLEGGALR